MIYLYVYLILQILSSIYLLIQCGGGKKAKKEDKPAAPAKPPEKPKEGEKKEGEKEGEKKDEKKEGEKKEEEKKEGEKKEEGSKPDEKKEDKKEGEEKKEGEKKEGEEKELKVDPTMASADDEKKKSKQEAVALSRSSRGKPDEKIKLSASSLAWEDAESQQVLKVTNENEKKQALKIKCSNNTIFKVNPVFAMIDAGKDLEIVVTRKAGELKAEKLLILTTPFDGTEAEKAYEDKELVPACATVPLVPK